MQGFLRPANPTFPGVNLHQVSSGRRTFTALFGMGRGGACAGESPAGENLAYGVFRHFSVVVYVLGWVDENNH